MRILKRLFSKCLWRAESDDPRYYETSCKQGFYFTNGTAKENDVVFCPFCGQKIVEVTPEQEED